MYLQITRIQRKVYPSGNYENFVKQVRLFKDDGTPIKFIKQTDLILEKLQSMKIPIEIPEIQDLLTENDMNKIFESYLKEKVMYDSTN